MRKKEQAGQEPSGEHTKNPLEIMREIHASLFPPLPEPPEGATWVGKKAKDMTEDEKKAAWEHIMLRQTIIAHRPEIAPDEDHPRYAEYMMAKHEWESLFRLSPHTLLKIFTI